MVKYIFFAVALIIAVNIFLVRCANIQPPTGGPKDLAAPKIKKTTPADKTVNFKGKELEIIFNEDIAQFGQQLIITPYYSKKIEVKVLHNKVKIEFQDLDSNTTYTINFREQVKDITEKNALVNYTFTFSTGPHLDSLSLKGSVVDLMTNQPIAGALISLYKSSDTSSISKDPPYYLSEANKSGSFLIDNIKKGDYRVYALKENNNTINYDTELDLIDFDTISLTKSISDLSFKVSKIDTTPPKIIHEKEENENTFLIRFSEGVKNPIAKSGDTIFKTLLSPDARDLKIYNNNTFPHNDTLKASISVSDSLGNYTDTLKVKIYFEKSKEKESHHNKPHTKGTEKGKKENEQVINKILPTELLLNPDTTDIKIYLNDPWMEIDLDSLLIFEDSIPIKLTKNDFILNEKLGLLEIKRPNKAKDSLLLILKKDLFITVNNDISSAQKIKFKIKKESDLGSLGGIITTGEESYIFQLLNDKYKPLISLLNPKKFQFKYLNPGTYYIRVLIDKNKNGQWDQASLKKGIKAEPVYFYKEKLDIRANWDIEDTFIEF